MENNLFNGEVITAKERAFELFLTIDGFGAAQYSLRDIEKILKSEKFECSDTTIAKWRDAENWETKRNALITQAVANQAPKDVPTLESYFNLSEYVNTIKRIDKKAAELLERGLDEMFKKPKLDNKDLTVLVKIKEVSAKSIDAMIELAAKDKMAKENTKTIKDLFASYARES